MRCPNCDSEFVRRSRLQTRDWACLALLRRPMRCNRCFFRFYAPFWFRPQRGVVIQRRKHSLNVPVGESLKLDPDAKPDLSGLDLPPRPEKPDDEGDEMDLHLAQ
jgi:hypothetical protein